LDRRYTRFIIQEKVCLNVELLVSLFVPVILNLLKVLKVSNNQHKLLPHTYSEPTRRCRGRRVIGTVLKFLPFIYPVLITLLQ
jgi:hypothetical protein